MNRLLGAAAGIALALTLSACGSDPYADAYGQLVEIEGVDEDMFRHVAETSCKFYEGTKPEFWTDSGLPTADETVAITLADATGLPLADARYLARMAGIQVCPEDALPHLFEDGQEALDDPEWRKENL